VGYYNIETSSRDGNFWYRMAQHYRNPEYLWAAEQVALGGRPPSGKVPAEYQAAYNERFAWFVKRGIKPKLPASSAKIGLLSALKYKVKERVYLNAGREPEKPFVAFFLYDKKDNHLDNVAGHLYEYSVNGVKLLHTSGKYNNVYSGNNLKGGGTGEESLDSLLVLHKRHPFPIHPDRQATSVTLSGWVLPNICPTLPRRRTTVQETRLASLASMTFSVWEANGHVARHSQLKGI
jgi:hypothetical protein